MKKIIIRPNGIEELDLTAEEITAREAEEKAWNDGALNRALEKLRIKRNNLLNETDWWGVSDNTMSAEQTQYRQDLRDITNGLDTVKKINAVVFPTKPN